MRTGLGGIDERDRFVAAVMHVTFFVLLGASTARFLQRHGGEAGGPLVIALIVLLALLYVLGMFRERWSPPFRLVSLGAVVAAWGVLVALAPSFAWVSVPLIYTALRSLPPVAAYVLVAVLTAFVILAQLRLAARFDIDLVVGPAAVAAFATAIFVHMQRQAARLRATERREGTLAERQRLSMEIHDTLAQGLSSQRLLLQAAERTWDSDPVSARAHVHTAASIAEHNLAEARRFVHDLAPADLARGGGLVAALHALAERETGEHLRVRVHIEGADRTALPGRVESALLRIAQGALANVREHAGATTASLTLTLLDDQVLLDVADDGRGFDPGARPEATGDRGHGIPAMRARVQQLGGTLTIESASGEGAVLSAAVPLPQESPR